LGEVEQAAVLLRLAGKKMVYAADIVYFSFLRRRRNSMKVRAVVAQTTLPKRSCKLNMVSKIFLL
jgi:hypothetical protein